MYLAITLLIVAVFIFMFLSALYYGKYYKEREKNIRLEVSREKDREAATTDSLTGLYNRRPLMKRMAEEKSRAVRRKYGFVTLFIDLDDFKKINDNHGHTTGDAVLIKVANEIKRIIRPYDIAARYGGDEFVVMLMEIPLEAAATLAKKIAEAIKRIEINDFNMGISASIGIHQFGSNNATEDPIEEADKAMYRAKDNGKSTIFVSKKSM